MTLQKANPEPKPYLLDIDAVLNFKKCSRSRISDTSAAVVTHYHHHHLAAWDKTAVAQKKGTLIINVLFIHVPKIQPQVAGED